MKKVNNINTFTAILCLPGPGTSSRGSHLPRDTAHRLHWDLKRLNWKELTRRTHSVIDEEKERLTGIKRNLGLHICDYEAQRLLSFYKQSKVREHSLNLRELQFLRRSIENYNGYPRRVSADQVFCHFFSLFEVVFVEVVLEEGVGLDGRLLRGASSCHYY